MKIQWGKLAGQLGIVYCLAGLFLVFLGWNGAATYNSVAAQIPYVISGGLAGLCLVVVGGSLLVASTARAGAAALEASVAELREAVERMGSAGATGDGDGARASTSVGSSSGRAGVTAGSVVAGPNSYHRPDCRLVEGQSQAAPTSAADAAARGLAPCRVCNPESAPVEAAS